jgi:NADH-quinone oxidoreductase subunit E
MALSGRDDQTVIETISSKYARGDASQLVPYLQDVQKEIGYLSEPAIRAATDFLAVPLSRVYAVATFYKAFSLSPRGDTILKVCVGTTCHIRGAMLVVDDIQKAIGVLPGETTADRRYSVETVGCVGACALSPVVIAGDQYLTGVKPGTIEGRLEKARQP